MEHKSIIGIILSAFFGIFKIWSSQRNRTTTELSLIHRNCIPLISTSKENDDTLKIEHKLPFNSNQYYYRGTFINSGTTDIYKALIIKPLKISFSHEIKILNHLISEQDNELEIISEVSDNEISFEWELLKPLEKFSFEIIIESAENFNIYELYKKISVASRIANIDNVKKNTAYSLENAKSNFLQSSVPTYFFLLLIYLFSGALIWSGLKTYTNPWYSIEKSITDISAKKKVEYIKYYDKNNVTVTHDDDTEKILPIKNLNDVLKVTIKKEIHKDNYWMLIIGIIAAAIVSIKVFFMIKTDLYNFKLKKIYAALH